MTTRGACSTAVTVTTVLIALLVGCGGGGSNGPGPTPGPTPFPTPSPTPLPNPLTIATAIPPGLAPGVAWGGARYLVAFSQTGSRGEPDVYGIRLAPNGLPVDDTPFLLSGLGDTPFLSAQSAIYSAPAVAFGPLGFGVFFFGSGNVTTPDGPPGQVVAFTSVTASGSPVQPAVELATEATFGMVATALETPIAASPSGESFAGLYQQVTGTIGLTLAGIEGSFASVSGGAIEPQGSVQLVTVDPGDQMLVSGSAPGVASNGQLTLAAWVQTATSTQTQQSTTTVDGAVIAVDAAPVYVPLSSANPGSAGAAVGSDGEEFLVVWTSAPTGDPSTLSEIRGIRYRPGPGVIDPDGGFVIASGGGAKTLGGVTFGSGSFLVVWQEGSSILATLVGVDGTVGSPLTIDSGPAANPAVASDGDRLLVVYTRPDGTSADLLAYFVPPAQ